MILYIIDSAINFWLREQDLLGMSLAHLPLSLRRCLMIPEILDLEVWYVVDLPAALQDEDMLQSGRQTGF